MYVARASAANTATTTAKGDRSPSNPTADFAGMLRGTAAKLDGPSKNPGRRDKPQDPTSRTQPKVSATTPAPASLTAIASNPIATLSNPATAWTLLPSPDATGDGLNAEESLSTLTSNNLTIAPWSANDPNASTSSASLATIPSAADTAPAPADPAAPALPSFGGLMPSGPVLPSLSTDTTGNQASSATKTEIPSAVPESAAPVSDPHPPAPAMPPQHTTSDVPVHTHQTSTPPGPTTTSIAPPSSTRGNPRKSDAPLAAATSPEPTAHAAIPHPTMTTPPVPVPHVTHNDPPHPQRSIVAQNGANPLAPSASFSSATSSAASSRNSDTASSGNGDGKPSRQPNAADAATLDAASTSLLPPIAAAPPVVTVPATSTPVPAPAGTGTLVPHASPTLADVAPLPSQVESHPQTASLHTARLLQTAGSSEMRVGLRSEEFGNITIHTTLGREQISARISVDSGQLGSALSVHLPAMQEKLEQHFGLNASVALDGLSGGATSGGNQTGADNRSGQQSDGQTSRHLEIDPTPRSTATTSDPYPLAAAIVSPRGRLDIRI